MALLLTEHDVRALLPMQLALEAVEECCLRQAKGEVAIEPRRRIEFAERAFLHSMSAADRAGGYFGAKLYATGRGPARFLVLLYSAETSHLLALIEADALGQLRTGAASGVATKFLARPDARTLGMIGTGYQAHTQLEAVAAVRRLESVRVFGRDAERRAAFAREMSAALGLAVEAVESAEQAVRGADIVITATSATRPVLEGKWLAEGAHVNAMGSNWAHKREIDDDAVRRAAVIAVDYIPAAKLEAGDLIQAFAGDSARWESVRELAGIVAEPAFGRTDEKEITLFKSVGIAAWDVAVAAVVYERAVARKTRSANARSGSRASDFAARSVRLHPQTHAHDGMQPLPERHPAEEQARRCNRSRSSSAWCPRSRGISCNLASDARDRRRLGGQGRRRNNSKALQSLHDSSRRCTPKVGVQFLTQLQTGAQQTGFHRGDRDAQHLRRLLGGKFFERRAAGMPRGRRGQVP